MPESELLNHFQCDIQCVLSNLENDNTNMKIILYKGKILFNFLSILKIYFRNVKRRYREFWRCAGSDLIYCVM